MRLSIRFFRTLALFFLAACGSAPNDLQVTGVVTLTGATDASGVLVSLVGPTNTPQSKTTVVKTTASGAFAFEKIDKGDYVLTATVVDSLEQQQQVVVSKAEKATAVPTLTFTLVATVTGQVNVQDAAGAPGAVISISGSGASAVTDGNGAFEIRGVKLGTQAIAASFRDYPVATGQVDVVRGTTPAAALTVSLTQPDIVVVPNGKLHGRLVLNEPGDFSFTKVAIVGSSTPPADVKDDGTFSLDLVPGTYALVAQTPYHEDANIGVFQVRSTIDLDIGSTDLLPFLRSFSNNSSGVGSFFSPAPVSESGNFPAIFYQSNSVLMSVSAARGIAKPLWTTSNPPSSYTSKSVGNGEQFIFTYNSNYFVADMAKGSVTSAGFSTSDSLASAGVNVTRSGLRIGGAFNPSAGGNQLRAYPLDGSTPLTRVFGASLNIAFFLNPDRYMFVQRNSNTTLSVVDLDGSSLDDISGTVITDAVNEGVVPVGSSVIAVHGVPGSLRVAIYDSEGKLTETQALANLDTVTQIEHAVDGGWLTCDNAACVATDGLLIRMKDAAIMTQPAAYTTLTSLHSNAAGSRVAYTYTGHTCIEPFTAGGTLDCTGNKSLAFAASTTDHGWLSATRWIGYDSGAAIVYIKDGDAAATTVTDVGDFALGGSVAAWTSRQGTNGDTTDDVVFVMAGDGAAVEVTQPTAALRHHGFSSETLVTSPDNKWSYVSAIDTIGNVFTVQINRATNQIRGFEGVRTTSNITNNTIAAYLSSSTSNFEEVLIVHDTLQRLWSGLAGSYQSFVRSSGPPYVGRAFFSYWSVSSDYFYQSGFQP